MKATIKLGDLTIEVEAETQKELFKAIASVHEVFDNAHCKLCKTITKPVWRVVTQGKKVFEYPEYHCQNPKCRAKLCMGSHMDGGGLFPIRKLDENGVPDRENGKWGEHMGWHKYVPPKENK